MRGCPDCCRAEELLVVTSRDRLSEAVADARLDVVTGAAAVTGGLALGAGPLVATAVGASAPVLKLLCRIGNRALDRRQDRQIQALEQAARILDVDLDALEVLGASDADRLELLARVLEAAARTPLDEKVTALSRVLAEGLRDEDSAREALVIVAAMADIEAAHAFVLQYLAMTPLPPEERRMPNHPEPRGWEASQLAAAIPEVAEILDGLLAVLSGHGLIRDQGGLVYPGSVGPAVWRVTALGRRCLLLFGEDLPEPADG